MNYFREDFLHFLWKNKLYHSNYFNYNDQPVEILDTGIHNHSSGPDFFNALIRIGETTWAGNVEIHVKASDWFRHGHQHDNAYDNVVLHVVYEQDANVFRPNNEEIPCIRLNFSSKILDKYNKLISNAQKKECITNLPGIEKIFVRDWLGKLMIERLEEKTSAVQLMLKENKYDWEESLYRCSARAFGSKNNADAFFLLSGAVPLNFVMKYRHSPFVLKAAFYGQAGFLENMISPSQTYNSLRKEYLAIKSLLPSPVPGRHIWKYMRTRPSAYPPTRIAQFISFSCKNFPFFERIAGVTSLKVLRSLIRTSILDYAAKYMFDVEKRHQNTTLPGVKFIDGIIINAFLPLFFTFGKVRNNRDICGRVLNFLEDLPPENNEIVKKWNKFGLRTCNVFDSQALIHLETRYCEKRRCLECMFGNRILQEYK